MYVSDDCLHMYVEVFSDSWIYSCMHACFYDVLVEVEISVSLKNSVLVCICSGGACVLVITLWLHL